MQRGDLSLRCSLIDILTSGLYIPLSTILAATFEEVSGEKIVAVGRYMRSKKSDKLAEVAFFVRDDWQNRGMGRVLLANLIAIAKERGVEGFVATVLHDNKSMMSVFHTCGYKLKTTFEEGVYELTFRFDEPN